MIDDLIKKLSTTAERAAVHAVRLRIAGNTHLAVSCESEARTLVNVVLDLKKLGPVLADAASATALAEQAV